MNGPISDLTRLPDEVTEQVFRLLPVNDILSCCLVNSVWREAVNKNIIWKRFCSFKLDLTTEQCFVKPVFQVPKCDNESLSPICENRLRYMREIHLRNNFRNNRCVDNKISRNHIDKTEFLDNYILMNNTYKNMFHVWNVEKKPVLVQSVPYLLQDMCTQLFQTFQNCLLIIQCNLLQLYVVADDIVSLKMCRIFDKEESFSLTIPAPEIISEWYSANIDLHPCDFNSYNEIVGKYFIGIVESECLNDSVMHIWDIESGKKLKQDNIPRISESVGSICCGNNARDLYIALYLDATSGARCKIFCYNLKELRFTDFYVVSNHSIPFMLFEENVILLPCDQWENSGSYVFLDSVTAKKIVEKKFDYPINPKAVDVYNSIMVFGSSNTVTVVDLNTQEEVLVFQVNFEVSEVYLLDHNILLVGGLDYHFVVEVWDIKRNFKLYKLEQKSILPSGRRFDRLAVQSMYNVYVNHYW